MDTFMAALEPMLMMFLCILIGFFLNKSGLAPENTGTVLSRVETYVFMPAQVMVTFMTCCTVSSLQENYRFSLYSILCIAVSMALCIPLSKLFSRDGSNRGVFRYALAFANFGFLGNALIPQMLGQQYLYPYMLFTLPMNTWAYTWGINQMVPAEQKKNPLKQLFNPVLLSLAVGAILGLTGIHAYIPGFLMNTLNNLSACMGPVAMILTGFIIGGYSVRDLLANKKVYALTALRLTVLPAIIILVLHLCGADRTVMTMALVAFGAALGLNSTVIPAAYGGDTRPGASMAMISHAGAVISLPLMYALLTLIWKG